MNYDNPKVDVDFDAYILCETDGTLKARVNSRMLSTPDLAGFYDYLTKQETYGNPFSVVHNCEPSTIETTITSSVLDFTVIPPSFTLSMTNREPGALRIDVLCDTTRANARTLSPIESILMRLDSLEAENKDLKTKIQLLESK